MEPEEFEFDEAFYLEQYPDVAAAGVDPYRHYLDFGIREGRLGARPSLRLCKGAFDFNPARETVLVVSHEASMTGAPILSLNIVRSLQRKYNVVSLLLGGGPLVADFRSSCVLSVEPRARRHHAELAAETILQLSALHTFRFAIVNSVESALVLAPLAKAGVRSLVLIHEFAAYTRPALLFHAAFAWASEVVFSTTVTYEDVIAHCPELSTRACHFIPQGRCTLLAESLDVEKQAQEMARIQQALRPPGLPADAIVVIGIGSVQMRKGVDLFIDCAARTVRGAEASNFNFNFVWIGDGLDTEADTRYSVFLTDQITRSGLEGRFQFMATTPLVEEVYKLADLFLLTSRLDPLPGVAIEAMSHGLPVLCFDGTTGIAEVLGADALTRGCVIPYLDSRAMAGCVLQLARDPDARRDLGERLRARASESFDMERYVASLDALASEDVGAARTRSG